MFGEVEDFLKARLLLIENSCALLQLSILQTCYEILSNGTIRNSDQHQFVISFLTKLVRHLFQKLKTSPMLFVDLFFWKSKQDCHCISANYAIHDLKKFSKGGKHTNKEAPVHDQRALLNSLGDDDDDDDMGYNAPVQDRRALLSSLGDDDDDDDDAKMPSVETLFKSMDRFVASLILSLPWLSMFQVVIQSPNPAHG